MLFLWSSSKLAFNTLHHNHGQNKRGQKVILAARPQLRSHAHLPGTSLVSNLQKRQAQVPSRQQRVLKMRCFDICQQYHQFSTPTHQIGGSTTSTCTPDYQIWPRTFCALHLRQAQLNMSFHPVVWLQANRATLNLENVDALVFWNKNIATFRMKILGPELPSVSSVHGATSF